MFAYKFFCISKIETQESRFLVGLDIRGAPTKCQKTYPATFVLLVINLFFTKYTTFAENSRFVLKK